MCMHHICQACLLVCSQHVQGYYRRADALFALGKIKAAYADFKRASKVAPRDPDLRKKLTECEKEFKRIRFEEALAIPVSFQSVFQELPCLEHMQDATDQAVSTCDM